MTPGFPETPESPVLVLALGNRLLGDDAAGLAILEALQARARSWGETVELLDGGTLGLALLGRLAEREAVVFLDAVALGAAPGTVHVLRGAALRERAAAPGATAHETSAADLLRAASLVGELPREITLVGVEPEIVRTGVGLSPAVAKAIAEASRRAEEAVEETVARLRGGLRG